jgi:ABC-type transporter Mla MlaB component
MEEAAIRYANGDDAGAEATLKAALSDAAASADKVDGWAIALFDFYRCTSQQDAFERWALEYADTFGRSAPSWVPPGQTVVENRRHAPVVGSSAAPGTVSWECPAALDEVAVSRLRDLVQVNAKSCQIRWGRLQTMSAPAARLLASVLAQWCEQPMILSFEGITTLKQLLQVQTPTGDPRVAESWWKLRLECLRMLRLTEDYELVALDFCVTFEVSPPPWCEPRCQCVTAQLSGAPNAPSALAGQPKDLLTATQSVASPLELRRSQGLSGEVTGDAHEVVAALQKRPVVQGVLLVDCAHLIRVDFSAAGSLLDWVANEQAKGKFVEFRDVPRLVAAFFNLIGINEHARVMSRNN